MAATDSGVEMNNNDDDIGMFVRQLDPFRIDNELIRLNSLQLFKNFTLPQSKPVNGCG